MEEVALSWRNVRATCLDSLNVEIRFGHREFPLRVESNFTDCMFKDTCNEPGLEVLCFRPPKTSRNHEVHQYFGSLCGPVTRVRRLSIPPEDMSRLVPQTTNSEVTPTKIASTRRTCMKRPNRSLKQAAPLSLAHLTGRKSLPFKTSRARARYDNVIESGVMRPRPGLPARRFATANRRARKPAAHGGR